jgi:uncharacterized protein YcnI
MSRKSRKIAIAAGASLMLALAAPLAASAHVTVTPYSAEPGSYALITFKVPNESATLTTTKVTVDIPTDTPFSSVSYVPVAGWTTTLETTTLPKPVKLDGNEITKAVTKVVWTAQPGYEISGGQLQLFPLSVGAVPDTGKIELATAQTYSDGSIVEWNESGDDAEHPAPTLYVNDAPEVSHDADAEVTAAVVDEAHPSVASPDIVARVLGILGLVVGAVGITLAVIWRRKATS